MTKKNNKSIKDEAIAFLALASMATFSSSYKGKMYSKEDELLSQNTRNDVYKAIENNEGIHFRELCRKLDKKMGVIQYHISVLQKNNLIRSVKDGRYKCFFSAKNNPNVYKPQQELSNEQKKVREELITAMKRESPKKIIEYLILEESASHQKLAEICGVSPQAITFHCQRLSDIKLIESAKNGRQKYYILSERAKNVVSFI